ncbi:hypothetical protein H310_04456 [Aphanomyces invadans]|uniref:Uncharacterized protein n=1 Tax=Aphanomyces invadans TaxID=157072 RepID=A0A024UDW5_9STRA|nr:hypothetical protein H310_04456 [Aphanomyces invadans]ETW04087.1 hypothetical protein H310_04456 [Aphanomyces invadans]|eukprot:XP_008867043.1 hypothetical protein H310_04456 [Aphanomyces invadans]
MRFDRPAFLERIALILTITIGLPFENLAVSRVLPVDPVHVHDVAAERVSLDADRIFQKLVKGKRGGYCLEQNAVFAMAWGEFRLTVDALAARVVVPP